MRSVQTGLRFGLIFGAVLLFVVLAGFFNAFAENAIVGIPVPRWILLAFGLWCGYVAGSRARLPENLFPSPGNRSWPGPRAA